MYEMHGYVYMWDCPRCTPIYKITLDVRLCVRCKASVFAQADA